VWIFGTEGTLRRSSPTPGASGGRRGDKALREIPILAERLHRVGASRKRFVNAIRGREKVTRTTFEDGVRYMEFTEAV
jgi:hypothetical protein